MRPVTVEQRLLARTTEDANGCWICSYSSRNGYPQIRVVGKPMRCNRVAYRLWIGSIPEGVFVCHSCDERRCINPEHLWLGTHDDNMADKVKKGRQSKGMEHSEIMKKVAASGNKNGNAKLSESEVKDLRRLFYSGLNRVRLAKLFDINRATVLRIGIGRSWTHI